MSRNLTMAPFKRIRDHLGISARTSINLKSLKKIDWLVHLAGPDGEEKKELWADVEKLRHWYTMRGSEVPRALTAALACWSVSIPVGVEAT